MNDPNDLAADVVADLPKLVSPTVAARALDRTTRTLRRWMGAGHIRTVSIAGGRPLVPRAELERLVREGLEGGRR